MVEEEGSAASESAGLQLLRLGYPLQRTLGLSRWEVCQVVVVLCDVEQPLALDVQAGADVVLGGQHKLLVQHPACGGAACSDGVVGVQVTSVR